jgi:5-oxoprolinase (ATP-hydrolysing)
MKKGDVVITNHPAFGGSHLPDITLIKPVFVRSKLMGYVANRAHHAEIGGSKPGSMPSDATSLAEEGVVIAPTYLIHRGKPQWNKITDILSQARYPTRALQENLADLNAAVASLTLGEQALIRLCSDHGKKEVEHNMTLLRRHASALLARKLKGLTRKKYKATEYLDDGTVLQVMICKKRNKIIIDFTGSSSIHPGNLNATWAIVNSVVLYVLRLWVNESVPLNEGLMQHVKLTVPGGMLNPMFSKNPEKAPAVVGGNTEISQRLTDTLLKALGLCACSQGTMNNFLFGNERFGYYETIGGGTGAGNGFNGADAVHQHMTNTRITDVEIMEWRYPVRVDKFEIRRNSGGKGKWSGGDGITRQITFFDDLEINVLTQHRVEKPYGMKGGMPGQTGNQMIIRKDGKREKLKAVDGTRIQAGDRVIIQTPGGGGWGKK